MAMVTTTEADSILTVRNPLANGTPLTITPNAGGTFPVSAHLVIAQVDPGGGGRGSLAVYVRAGAV